MAATQDGTSSPQSSPEPRASSPEPRAASPEPRASSPEPQAPSPDADKKAALKAQALADSGVQAMLEVFPAEIRDVEEM